MQVCARFCRRAVGSAGGALLRFAAKDGMLRPTTAGCKGFHSSPLEPRSDGIIDPRCDRIIDPRCDRIMKYKREVIVPNYYDPKEFALNICNPMMKVPNEDNRILCYKEPQAYYDLSEGGRIVSDSFRQIFYWLGKMNLSFLHPVKISDFWITESYKTQKLEILKGLKKDRCLILEEQQYKFILKDGILLKKLNRSSAKCDYFHGSKVLQEFLSYTCDLEQGLFAEDLTDFFKWMESATLKKGYPLYVHPVFLSMDNRSDAFLDIYDMMLANQLSKSLEDAILKDVMPLNWPDIAQGNEVLLIWYNKLSKNFDTSNPWKFMTFLRHVNRHPVHDFVTSFGQYQKFELQRLLKRKFHRVLPKLYENLWEKKELSQLRPHRFFVPHSA